MTAVGIDELHRDAGDGAEQGWHHATVLWLVALAAKRLMSARFVATCDIDGNIVMIPVISGTVAGQTVTPDGTINPFINTSITDGNDYIHDTTLTISVLGANGQPTDTDGTLSLPSADLNGDTFSETSSGVYTLVDTSTPSPTRDLPHFQPQLSDLTFIPSSAGTTTLALNVVDSDNEHQSNATTTVTASGAGAASITATPVSTGPDLTVSGHVSAGTTENLTSGDGQLTIDHLRAFHGQVDLGNGDIDLNGLVAVDSYSFANDMLSFSNSNGQTIGRLRLTSDSSAFSVEKSSSGVVSIYTANDTLHGTGTALPSHT